MIPKWFRRSPTDMQRALGLVNEAVHSLQGAVRCAQEATDTAHRALALVDELSAKLADTREELAVYHLGAMEEDAQVGELERVLRLS